MVRVRAPLNAENIPHERPARESVPMKSNFARTAAILAVMAGSVLAGCSTSDPQSEDYDPTLTAVRQTLTRPETLPPEPFVAEGARRTGRFPSFGRMPQGAMPQMTDIQRQMIEAEMAAALAEQRDDRVAATRYRERLAELQEIARTHGIETRRQIEN